jgi:fatty-acyl-CoA synthase
MTGGLSFRDVLIQRLRRPERVCFHYYSNYETEEAWSWGAVAGAAATLRAALEQRTSAGELAFVLHHDPAAQMCAWIAAILAGLTPAILTPPTAKLDPVCYAEEIRGFLRLHAGPIICGPDILDAYGLAEGGRAIPFSPTIHADKSAEPLIRSPLPDQPLIFQQSSGTTGLRKGLLLGEAQVCAQLQALGSALDLSPGDSVVSWLPLYHDMGLVAVFMNAIFHDLPQIVTSPFVWLDHPAWLLRAIDRHRATLCWLPNFAFIVMARQSREAEGVALDSLRRLINCSEPVTAAALEAFSTAYAGHPTIAAALSASYALAENCFAATQTPAGKAPRTEIVDRDQLDKQAVAVRAAHGTAMVSSGRALSDVEIRIIRDGVPAGDGAIGEIEIASPFLLTGYCGATAPRAALTKDGWYRTGDRGYLRAGELFVLGRSDDIIVRGGQNIEPSGIEEALSALEGIKPGRVAAFGLENPQRGTQDLIVIAEFSGERAMDIPALRQRARLTIATACGIAPDVVEIVRERWLAKSSSGKVSRAKCRDHYVDCLEKRRMPAYFPDRFSPDIPDGDKDCFFAFGSGSRLRSPAEIYKPGRIEIGNWVTIGRFARISMDPDLSSLEAVARQHYPAIHHDFPPLVYRGTGRAHLRIGDGTAIGNHFFLTCRDRVEIGQHVVISDRVFITDSSHIYDHPELPIGLQGNTPGSPVIIGDHSWIGVGASIFEGVTIGRHAIVGAGAVVTSDVPDYSLVIGNPARLVKYIGAREADAQSSNAKEAVASQSAPDLQGALLHFLRDLTGGRISSTAPLLSGGLLDSIQLLSLAIFLEDATGRAISIPDLIERGFDTAESLITLARSERRD